ncbi:MAG: radical SAM protein [Thermodesulfobacteriota bacterium]
MSLSAAGKKRIVSEILPGLWQRLKHCDLCPRECGVDRLAGEEGFCALSGDRVPVASYCVHRGEEPVISGSRGSGTIFFAHCNLGCVFCQNDQISDNALNPGEAFVSVADLAEIMRLLQAMGCHNINFVTPTHVLPYIIAALEIALDKGLTVPLVYNCGGYEKAEVIRLLDGVMEVYLPDIKYMDASPAAIYSRAKDYPQMAAESVKEMYRQTGSVLEIDPSAGTAARGMIIRHLVLPGCVENSLSVLEWIAGQLSPDVHISLMSQYHPSADAMRFGAPLNRTLRPEEYETVSDRAEKLGIENGWFQEMESHRNYRPDFRKKHPFEG